MTRDPVSSPGAGAAHPGEPARGRYQGVWSIVRFNWHFYALAAVGVLGLAAGSRVLPAPWGAVALAAAAVVVVTTVVSLAVSHYVYDVTGFYGLDWVCRAGVPPAPRVVNVHAGFDETSRRLARVVEPAELRVLDFYDPQRHTEPSIRRARRTATPYPGTLAVAADDLPLEEGWADRIYVLVAAHEIRDPVERAAFFAELRRVLAPGGRVVVAEHLRDAANALAFNLGCLHFHSRGSWHRTFRRGGLRLVDEWRLNPFVAAFVLEGEA